MNAERLAAHFYALCPILNASCVLLVLIAAGMSTGYAAIVRARFGSDEAYRRWLSS